MRFKQLEEAPPRGAIVPLAVPPDDFQQLIGGRIAIARGHPGRRQLEPGLMVVRIRREPRFEGGRIDGRGRCDLESSAGAREPVVSMYAASSEPPPNIWSMRIAERHTALNMPWCARSIHGSFLLT